METEQKADDQALLTTKQAAAKLGIKPVTLSIWRTPKRFHENKLKFLLIGRSVRYPPVTPTNIRAALWIQSAYFAGSLKSGDCHEILKHLARVIALEKAAALDDLERAA